MTLLENGEKMNLKYPKIFCHTCGKWIDIRTNTYYPEPEVRCLNCDTLLGYDWDIQE